MAQGDGDRQDQYRELMAEGKKLPGVAEAIEVYEAAHRSLVSVPVTGFQSRTATGGNV
jgi:hypothetical protein